MDLIDAEDNFVPVEEFAIQDMVQTSDNFQKFMYELFDKNGIINDLRAYLRGHIVNILKSAETGDLPACQKHFTQRLQLPFQAFNVLIVEYLLAMEFNYTLSVFISEIPLANMVFEFTKDLLNSDSEAKMSSLQFEDGDVWSVLNYLGLKCSSEYALKIVEMYKSEKQPLLLCILKCVSMYQKGEGHISDQSSMSQSSDTLGERTQGSHGHISKCKHFMYCKACQYRVARLKEKYKRKKARIEKKNRSSIKKVNVETFMNKMSVLEQTLIDEMFQKLKTVYEAEVEIVKEEQHKKIQQSIASHTLQLQKHREEMEESFKAREEELSQAIQLKKRFLWGLARSLRDQHEHLTRAMTDVRRQTELLTHKESTLKTQLEEAEQTLKKRGEDMRNQISEELVILERNLENMKKERDRINEERKEIEILKIDKKIPTEKDFKPQYEFLKTELSILRKYIEATKLVPKRVTDRGTVTDFGFKCFMNNENIDIKIEKLENNRVINDLKKRNNINYSQSNLEDINDIIMERPSTVCIVGDTGVTRDDTGDIKNGDNLHGAIRDVYKGNIRDRHLRVVDIQDGAPGDSRGCDVDTLRQENIRLKSFANKQREYIQVLFNEKDRLQRALTDQSRPRTAPVASDHLRGQRVIPDASPACPRGSDGQGRDSAGGLHTRFSGRWMRRASGTTLLHAADDTGISRAEEIHQNTSNTTQRSNQQSFPESGKVRENNTKSVLKEAKEKLLNSTVKQRSPKYSDKSSDATLREAKRRLRKLEIEAEAVEKSYQDFRKRQSELREKRENLGHIRDNLIETVENSDVKHKTFKNDENKTIYERNLYLSFPKESPETMKRDFDKYFREYTAKVDFNKSRFANKNSVIENVNPIPAPFGNREVNYLETPIMEFRKLYQGQRTKKHNNIVKDVKKDKKYSENKIKSFNLINNNSEVELQDIIKTSPEPESAVELKNEANTVINSNEDTKNGYNNVINNEITHEIDNKNNLLLVEVENGCDNVVVSDENKDLLIVVESSVDNRETSDVEEQICTQMTIIVSPKEKGGSKDFVSPVEGSRSISPESPQMDALKHILEADKEKSESISEVEKNRDDYLDDFSADVDNYNYNSTSEYGNNSPISLPKTSEDEKYWES